MYGSKFLQSSRLLTIVLIFITSAAVALAQPGRGRGMKIKAEGSVVDSKTNDPLVGAAVKVTSADGGTGTFGICDTEGNFTFEVDHPGKYTLEVTYVGYKMLTKDVTLYPLWDKTVEYLSVALVTNGGAIDNRPRNNPRVYNVAKDSTISLPTAINMEKEGFIFAGWYPYRRSLWLCGHCDGNCAKT